MLNANTICQEEALERFFANTTTSKTEPPQDRSSEKNKKLIFNIIKEHKGVNRLKLIKRSGKSSVTVRACLIALIEEKKISKVVYGRSGIQELCNYFEFGKEIKILTINEEVSKKIMTYITKHKRATNKTLNKALGITWYRIKIITPELNRQGLIKTTKHTNSTGSVELLHTLVEIAA